MQQPTVRSEKEKPQDRRLGRRLFGPQCLANLHGEIDGHLWVCGVSASTSARSKPFLTGFSAGCAPASASKTMTRSLGLGHIWEFCLEIFLIKLYHDFNSTDNGQSLESTPMESI